jgi:hypothetical protein
LSEATVNVEPVVVDLVGVPTDDVGRRHGAERVVFDLEV